MGLAPGPSPLVPVGGLNQDQRLPFSPGSCHQPGPMRCLYIPPCVRAEHTALFFLAAEGERAWWCSSSPPMHTRCSMDCPSHTTYAFSSPSSTSTLHFPQYLSRFSGPSRPVPVFTAVDHLRRSHRRHHRGEPLVLIFFLKGKIFLLVCLDRYLYYFLPFIIASYIVRWFWYPPPSALVLSMIQMWYILSFHNYWFIYCL